MIFLSFAIQFDGWIDIHNDINNGYNNCCIKEILFQCLNITNTKQKECQYAKLVKCAEIAYAKLMQQDNHKKLNRNRENLSKKMNENENEIDNESGYDFNQELQEITDNIFNTFCIKFNDNIANEIVSLFDESIEECQYEEIDAILDDFEVINDSDIISYILEHIEMELFSIDEFQHDEIKITISNHLKNSVITNVTNEDEQKIEPEHSQHNHDEIHSNITEICENIITYFSSKYNQIIAEEIKQSFIKQYHILIENAYNHTMIMNEAKDIDDCDLFSDLSANNYDIEIIKKELQCVILGHTYNNVTTQPRAPPSPSPSPLPPTFRIQNFVYNLSDQNVMDSNKLVSSCNGAKEIYQHQHVSLRDFKTTPYPIASAALCVVKAIDIVNRLPIMRWFFKCRTISMEDRSELLHPNVSNELIIDNRWKNDKWWNENKYFQWIQNYPNFSIKNMSVHIKAAIEELTDRALQKFNYSPKMMFSKIMDNINDLAKYTLASYHVVVDIRNRLKLDELEWCPIQIDFMVIPQAVIKPIDSNKNAPKNNKTKYKVRNRLNTGNIDGCNIYGEEKEYEIVNFGSDHTRPFWDLEEIMDDPRVGYIKNANRIDKNSDGGYYWLEEIKCTMGIYEIKTKMYEMIKKCQDMLEINGLHRYRRYVFIIDRRDKVNLKRHNMEYKKPNIQNEFKKMMEKDRLYLIIHKEYHKLPNELYSVQESGLGLSKALMIRKYSDDLYKAVNHGIFDDYNSYKFAFTYHIHSKDNITPYFYRTGGKILQLNDLNWLWPRWFMNINGNPQTLDQHNKSEIEKIANDKNLQLRDIAFEEFTRQCDEIRLYHYPMRTNNVHGYH